jgi:hypothetical protein
MSFMIRHKVIKCLYVTIIQSINKSGQGSVGRLPSPLPNPDHYRRNNQSDKDCPMFLEHSVDTSITPISSACPHAAKGRIRSPFVLFIVENINVGWIRASILSPHAPVNWPGACSASIRPIRKPTGYAITWPVSTVDRRTPRLTPPRVTVHTIPREKWGSNGYNCK